MDNATVERESTEALAGLNWSAVWAGVFTFIAIWSVFGALCLAIFAGSASLAMALSVWGIILTIIAMFVAGRMTSQLAGIANSRDGVVYGMTMFGLSVTSALVILVMGGTTFDYSQIGGTAHSSVLSVFRGFGWALFLGLLLGWLAAIGGASSAHKELTHPSMQHQVRHA
jgi:hypothetical protein